MTKEQIRMEFFRVKSALNDALIDEAYRQGGGTDSPLWIAVKEIWKEMNEFARKIQKP